MNTRIQALDGLRGLAVAAVVVNHVSPGTLRGGWLGVDIFFVLSGYLITSILLNEYAVAGHIDLRGFYTRRIRRLLPALIVLLLVLAVVTRLAPGAPGFDDLRGDGVSALGYVANWHFIATGASYFNAFAPSPLRHLWSLSIEEQFYLVWPILLLFVLKHFGRGAVGVVAVVLACASAASMAVLYGNGANVSRAYFGTDTHAHGILLGCALGVIGQHVHRLPYPRIVALLGLAGIAFAVVELDGTDAAAYRGGIAGVGLLTAVVIAALIASEGRGPAAWLLQRAPIVGLGVISYGVYLWHWPILEFMTADRVGVSGWRLIVLQLGLTLAIAVASFVLVERVVRSGWPRPRVSWITAPAAVIAVVTALVFVVPVINPPFAVADQQARARSADTKTLPAAVRSNTGPRRVMLVGDSVAYTLFPGLVAHERASDLYFLDAAESGCPLEADAAERQQPGAEAVPEHLPQKCQWSRVWPDEIKRTRPDLIVALWGLWDVYDIEIDHVWLRVGTPEWTSHMEATLNRALDVLTAQGTRVAILTTPYLLPAPGWRVDALNQVFRAVAAERPKQLAVVDIQPATDFLQPQRWDSVHYTVHGADVLSRAVDPMIANLMPRTDTADLRRSATTR